MRRGAVLLLVAATHPYHNLNNLTTQAQICNHLSFQQFGIERIVFSDTTVTGVG